MSSRTSVVLSQVIELGKKRSNRVKGSTYDLELTRLEFEAKRLDIIKETKQRFIEVLASQQSLELAQKALSIADNIYNTVRDFSKILS